MTGTYYKNSQTNGMFQIKTTTNLKPRGGQTVYFGGSAGAIATVAPGVPTAQLVGWAMIQPVTWAQQAAGTAHKPVFQPLSTGQYAKTRAGQYIMLGQSSYIAGLANTLLVNPAGDSGSRRSINTKVRWDRSFKVTSINYITGALSGSAKTYYWRDQSAAAVHPEVLVSTQQDHVVVPNISRTIPGEFTLSETGQKPTNKKYPGKTD